MTSWFICRLWLYLAVLWFPEQVAMGLTLRASAESPHVGPCDWQPVLNHAISGRAVLAAAGMAGIAGAYLSLVQTPMWVRACRPAKAGSRSRSSYSAPGADPVVIGAYLFAA